MGFDRSGLPSTVTVRPYLFDHMRILITGGAGFVGSQLAVRFREQAGAEVVAFDNLRRRGAELNLPLFRSLGIGFVHGDIRQLADLDDLSGAFDLVIDASAEPSVLAGFDGSPQYVLQTNLVGTLNCLEFARRRSGGFVFLSTSRVYSIAPLRSIGLIEAPTRFELDEIQSVSGVGPTGIDEAFPTHLPRSLYGATKLASELIVQEYAAMYGLPAVINRCGVIAGAGQFGKVDQGIFTLWVAHHHFGRPLTYTGFGGSGKQVRDLLHPADLYALLTRQIDALGQLSGGVFNVGGGRGCSTSLVELTALCREATGREVPVGSQADSASVDVPLYLSNTDAVHAATGWRPSRTAGDIVGEIADWLRTEETSLKPLFT